VTLLFAGLCHAQTQFARAVGGADSDGGNSVVLTSDKGCIVTGRTRSFGVGEYDLFLAKFDSLGILTWAETVGGVSWYEGNSVTQTSDKGYVVTGVTYSFGAGNYDLFLGKFDSSGNLTWAKTVGGADEDWGNSVAQTPDKGYIVTGWTVSFGAGEYDLFLAKFDSLGNLTWTKTVGGTNRDKGNSVVQIPDGGYIVTGWTASFGAGSSDLFLGKFDSLGNLTWAKTVGGVDGDEGYSVELTPDEGYIVTGYTVSFGADSSDLFLIKFDSLGGLTWAKTVGGTNNDEGNSVSLTSDKGCIVTGKTRSFGVGSSDLFLGKFDSLGDLTWAKTVGGANWDGGYSIAQTSDEGYIVTGYTASFGSGSYDFFLGKFSSSGEIWDCPFVADCSPVVISRSLSSVSVSPTVTTLSLSAVSCSPTVASISPVVTEVCSDISEALTKPISFELTISPNPFNSSCAIATPVCATIEIFDLQGKLVWNKPSDSDNIGATSLFKGGKPEEVPLNKGDVAKRQGVSASAQGVIIWQPDETISSGVYLVRATTDEWQITKRVVYLK
jgi:hypothetical protein